ncbi:MAG TPA: biotin/lipoyl-containing protein, partial [Burkholderiaceae bacterium]|nr:biotin/lipoyl-containing protein [Burkholderiaceae bacterium]
MALIEVKVPQLSESVAEATLLQWHKKPGEAIARDENLIDIETDKVVLEVPAPSNGVLSRVLKEDGATVVAGETIAVIDTDAVAGAAAPSGGAGTAAPAAGAAPPPAGAAAGAPAAAGAGGGARPPAAMPSAAKLMSENQLSPAQVGGTGRDGRITKGDVLAAIAQPAPAAGAAAAPAAAPKAPAPAPALPAVKPPVD